MDFREDPRSIAREIGIAYVFDDGGIVSEMFYHGPGLHPGVFLNEYHPPSDSSSDQRLLLLSDSIPVMDMGFILSPPTSYPGLNGVMLTGYTGCSERPAILPMKSPKFGAAEASYDQPSEIHGFSPFCRYMSREVNVPEGHPVCTILQTLLHENAYFIALPKTYQDAKIMYAFLLEETLRQGDESHMAAFLEVIDARDRGMLAPCDADALSTTVAEEGSKELAANAVSEEVEHELPIHQEAGSACAATPSPTASEKIKAELQAVRLEIASDIMSRSSDEAAEDVPPRARKKK